MSETSNYRYRFLDFLDLMNNYQIIIPKIQRDYAQGRNTEKAKSTRENFSEKLVNAIHGDYTLPLDFVYGTKMEIATKGNENGKTDNKISKKPNLILYPLDGQQRLTTLLLLAWLCNKTESHWFFSYESRRVTQAFIKELLKHPFVGLEKHKNVSDTLRNSPWFFQTWEDDVSVSGMLNMLDSLMEQIQKKTWADSKYHFENIYFYVNAFKWNATDYNQIFLKMNARGKPLSGWENLKACLDDLYDLLPKKIQNQNLLPAECKDKDAWTESINLTWPEKIWENSYKNIEAVDRTMECVVKYAFAATFRNDVYISSVWEKNIDNNNERPEESSRILKRDDDVVLLDYIIEGNELLHSRFEDYFGNWHQVKISDNNISTGIGIELTGLSPEKREEFVIDFFETLSIFFSSLIKLSVNNTSQIAKLMSPWRLGMQSPDLCHLDNEYKINRKLLLIYYVLEKCHIENSILRESFSRVVWNLVYNTNINDINDFRNVFQALRIVLIKHSTNILPELLKIEASQEDSLMFERKKTSEQNIMLDVFKEQWIEECDKAKQIIAYSCNNVYIDEPWYLSITYAEQYAFFHGCIRFLYRDANGKSNWSYFDTKLKNALLFFDDSGIKNDYRVKLTQRLVYGAFNSGYIWDRHSYFFTVNAESWLTNVLKQSDWRQKTVHSILMDEGLPRLQWPNSADDSEYLKSLYALFSNESFPWDFIIDKMSEAYFKCDQVSNNHYCFFCHRWWKAIYIDCGKWRRNEILRQLQNNTDFEIVTNNPINNDILFFGYVVEIKYKTHTFKWTPANDNYNQSCITYMDKDYKYEIDSIDRLREILDDLLDK